MKKIVVAAGLVLVAAMAGVVVYFSLGSEPSVVAENKHLKKPAGITLADTVARARTLVAQNVTKAKKKRAKLTKITYNDRDDLTGTEKRQLNAIQSALDQEDLAALLKVLPEASKSSNVEVRTEMVEALGWFGEEAMLELLPFMADRDEDVAQSAMDSWTTALSEIDNEQEKATLIESAMLAVRDEDSLDSMVMELSDCDDLVAMQTVINLIESPNRKAARAAREHYEFMTGEEYTTLEAAEKWMCENYEIEDKDGSVSTMAERQAARSRKTETTAKRTSSRRSSSTGSTSRGTDAAPEVGQEVSEGGLAATDGAGAGDADEGVDGMHGENPESTTDEIIGDSNKLLEEEGALTDEGEAEEELEEGAESVPPPAQ